MNTAVVVQQDMLLVASWLVYDGGGELDDPLSRVSVHQQLANDVLLVACHSRRYIELTNAFPFLHIVHVH